MTGSKLPAVQRLQFFLSESVWDPEAVNARRLELLRADSAAAPHGGGVLVIDDSGDRKDGARTAHVGRQWPGRYGTTGNGVVTVTTAWADERLYYPGARGAVRPGEALRERQGRPGIPDQAPDRRGPGRLGPGGGVRVPGGGRWQRLRDQDGFRGELSGPGLLFVLALRPRHGIWPGPRMRTPRWTPPARWPGAGRMIGVTGSR